MTVTQRPAVVSRAAAQQGGRRRWRCVWADELVPLPLPLPLLHAVATAAVPLVLWLS